MKFLITGGAGFVGSYIAEELINSRKAEAQDIVIFDNLSVGKEENIPKGCRLIKGDVRNKNEIEKAMKNIDIVFHNAAFVSIRASFDNLQEELETNCLGTLNVLESCAKNNAQKIIFASSMAVYGEPKYLPIDENHPAAPLSPYGLSKLRGEMYCNAFRKAGVKAVILRYFNVFGTRQTPSDYVGVTTIFINQALQNKPLTILGDGSQTRDFVWVRDVAKANVLAAFSDAEGIFNIASGKEHSINEIADAIISRLGGKKACKEKVFGEVARALGDISKAKKELGFSPQGDILEKIPEIIDWWKEKKRV